MTKDKINDFTLRVANANKTQMIVILYDITLTYLDDAKDCLAKGDKLQFRTELNRARNSINELIASVNTSDELGLTLLRLYIFANGEISRAYLDYDGDHVKNVRNIISKLNEAYKSICSNDTSAAVMTNAEKVYTGFTYNPYGRSENITDGGANRGILA